MGMNAQFQPNQFGLHVWIAFSGITAPKNKRAINNVVKKTNEDLLWKWHSQYLPKHFTRAAYKEYGYMPRQGEPGYPFLDKKGRKIGFKKSYTGRKLAAKGHTNPFVWSGATMAAALNRANANVNPKKLSYAQASISFPIGWVDKSRNLGRYAADELTRVSPGEVQELAEWYLMRLADNIALVQ